MYDMDGMYGLINLYITHLLRNLTAYYFRNLSFDDYHRDMHSKLKSNKKLKIDAASMTFDEVVAWENKESISPLQRAPRLKPIKTGIQFPIKNLYANFLHADCADDHFDPFDYWKYEDVYRGGCFDVGGFFKGFDWIDELVGSDDRLLSGKSKDEFSNDVILDDVVSSLATTLSLLLKLKGESKVMFT
nr:transposase, MuDR, MULE transposase domain protein [Tanacetum cinerariifolium]